jgi:choline dehydrogenase-like flavoprotein
MAFFDARRLAPEGALQADLCVVGAGAAGIALAREFIGTRYRVTVLESGGHHASHQTQRLYAGENVGLPSYALTYSRFRLFGGTTSRWAAQCRPLDPIDFQSRPGIAYSGWPFDHRGSIPRLLPRNHTPPVRGSSRARAARSAGTGPAAGRTRDSTLTSTPRSVQFRPRQAGRLSSRPGLTACS